MAIRPVQAFLYMVSGDESGEKDEGFCATQESRAHEISSQE
jgi:hypothetical protein